MILNESQVEEVKKHLKKNNIESRLVFDDFLDHICCMIEQGIKKGASFEKSLESAFNYCSVSEIKKIEIITLKLLNMETLFSRRTALLATIPFALFGLTWAFSNSGLNIPEFIQSFLFITSVISMFVLFFLGWIKDFPRWSFPAIGFSLLFSLFFMNVSVPMFSRELLGFWAWIPLLIILVICLVFKPSINPVKKLFKRIKSEPGLILFMLYGFVPFFLFLCSDEIYWGWMILIAVLSTLILSAGIYFFLRSERKSRRYISIITSGTLALITTFFSFYFY